MKGYKLFRVKKLKKNRGLLFPLFVNANTPLEMNKWIDAEEGERKGKGVKSLLGTLAFRPGWHISDLPIVTHIGVKDSNGNIVKNHWNYIWCEVEYKTDNNYQDQVDSKKGLQRIPTNGYYRFKTNNNQYGDWIIAGNIKINKVLSDEDVREILRKENKLDLFLPRENGDINISDYGF